MNRVGFHATHETQASKMVFLDSVDYKTLRTACSRGTCSQPHG